MITKPEKALIAGVLNNDNNNSHFRVPESFRNHFMLATQRDHDFIRITCRIFFTSTLGLSLDRLQILQNMYCDTCKYESA